MELAIRKSTGLDDVLGRIKPQTVEETRPAKFTDDPLIAFTLEHYRTFLNAERWQHPLIDAGHGTPEDLEKYSLLLTPAQINTFLQEAIRFDDNEYYHSTLGPYVSLLMQRSFNAGNNNFSLQLSSSGKMNCLGAFLKGVRERPLYLHLEGKVGIDCSAYAQYLHLTLKGDAQTPLFKKTRFSSLYQEGKIITSNPSDPYLLLNFDTGHIIHQLRCDIVVTNKNSFDYFLRVTEIDMNNTVTLKYLDGKEERVSL